MLVTGTAMSVVSNSANGNSSFNGSSRGDDIRGGPESNRIFGGRGADDLKGGRGKDFINSRESRSDDSNSGRSKPDNVNCGRGYDRVVADKEDKVSSDCERVLVLSAYNEAKIAGKLSEGNARLKFNSYSKGGRGIKRTNRVYSEESVSTASINGKELRVKVDPKTRALALRVPNKVVLSSSEKQALNIASKEIGSFVRANSGQGTYSERELLLRELSYLASVPEGYEFKSKNEEASVPEQQNGATEVSDRVIGSDELDVTMNNASAVNKCRAGATTEQETFAAYSSPR